MSFEALSPLFPICAMPAKLRLVRQSFRVLRSAGREVIIMEIQGPTNVSTEAPGCGINAVFWQATVYNNRLGKRECEGN